MNLQLIAVGKSMPSWVMAGFEEYAKRLPHPFTLQLIELPAGKRGKGANIEQLTAKEGELALSHIPPHHHVIALTVDGKPWSTEQLAEQLADWRDNSIDVSLLIGGPEGLAPACLARANQRWSLSALTLPHPLVRIVVAEQLYRAWSILAGHPYHR
ncbi:MAG: 23S rRNA (pseudouridine(1915)-N(3))-methyltransferase RlmH [Legionellales bacterium]|nr:23S rRNA (pseudouridine(1915)-N(3))-methyltransferase RlmH [Legionellales bacterium]